VTVQLVGGVLALLVLSLVAGGPREAVGRGVVRRLVDDCSVSGGNAAVTTV